MYLNVDSFRWATKLGSTIDQGERKIERKETEKKKKLYIYITSKRESDDALRGC